MTTRRICIKKDNLRKLGYQDLEDWLKSPNHLYLGRHNAWVKGAAASKWKNPFSISKYGLAECLQLYKKHLIDSGLINEIEELRGSVLGCWCNENDQCHTQILIDLLNELSE
jgi:hypothetical protein